MNNEEYNKILQLVKSDCPNNRLLGFQLAKGLDYDLMELLNNTKSIGDRRGASHFKTYHIGKYVFKIKNYADLNWVFTIDSTDGTAHNAFNILNVEKYSEKYWKAYNVFAKYFINLIINE